ncbi:hypothetical protein [Aureivirga marina]|uniref:hypothetical protein n=1 Tax=Aureivirga marina TaxID=1182451 RepID=UPI0018CB9FE4|nr:hypothetical protein [Aureivirga marina]
MKNNNMDPLEEFQKILNEQHENAVSGINQKLFDDIIKTAKIAEKTEDDEEFKDLTNNLRERFKNEDLNQVTDLFIYCQGFLSRNDDPVPMPSKLCISLGKLFTEENLYYTACKIYDQDEIESGCALSFLGYLAIFEQHESYIFNFLNENFEGFSQNKKTECVYQLKSIFPENEIAKKIIDKSGITEYKLVFSTDEDSSSKPITFKLENEKRNKENQSTSESKISSENNKKDDFINNTEEKKNPKRVWWKFWGK